MKLSLVLLSSLLFVACQKEDYQFQDRLVGDGLLADRPVGAIKSQILLLELNEKPLLDGVSRAAGSAIQVDEERLASIKKEQNQFEAQLKSLNPEIKVLFRYQYLLNGFAILSPPELEKSIRDMAGVRSLKPRQIFNPPKIFTSKSEAVKKALDLSKTSVTHIEAPAAYEQGYRGQSLRVGVLDTGIDYTHAMFLGSGKKEDFTAVKPDQSTSAFPNKKVVGGIDLAGTDFDAASLNANKKIPKPDANPIDEEGHGTHVAGSIAGVGDGVNTYDGVAPEALLYAIKVFGSGSTSDEVVIAGLEWSVDPNQDGDLSDQLHVVNLSLGGGFGTPYELYNKAVSHLSQAGTIVVASAGNSSDVPYIVGSPSTSDEALSVAASIDGSDHNWRFKTVGFFSGDKEIGLAEAFEAQTSKPIAEAGDVKGELVFVGLADKDFSEAESALIKGKVALIDRGVVTFQEKMSRAQAAGAIGVVVAQNRPEAPFTMGGDKKLEILAIMIGQDLGKLLKAELENGAVQVVFQNPKLIEKPELINQITDFSSRGPRSTDLLIKPEITGPGQNIISAAMGEGNGGVKLSGTSMSGPHLAGVMALLSQKFPQLSSRELKSVVMSTSFSVKDKEGRKETVAKQGAGHVSVARALKAQFVTEPSSLTLGLQSITQQKRVVRTLKVKSLFDDQIKLKVSLESSSSSVKLTDSEVLLDPKGLLNLRLNFILQAVSMPGLEEEVTGWVVLSHGEHQQRVPFLVRLQKVSQIKLQNVKWGAGSAVELEGSSSEFEFKNESAHAGDLMLFNFLEMDDRKPAASESLQSRECDLRAVGYRLRNGQLEVAVKLHNRISVWSLCEVSVLMDKEGDEKPELELSLSVQERVPGLSGQSIVSALLDYPKARELRLMAEKKAETEKERVELDLKPAILALVPGRAESWQSFVIMKVDISEIQSRVGLEPKLQVVTSSQESRNTEADDYLKTKSHWQNFTLDAQSQSWLGLTDLTLQGGQSRSIELEKGASPQPLMVIFPQNPMDSRGIEDKQMEIIKVIGI